MAATACSAPPSVTGVSSATILRARKPTNLSPCPNGIGGSFAPYDNPNSRLSILRVSHATIVAAPKRVWAVSSLEDGNYEIHADSEPSSSSSPHDATTGIKLPRRSLIVQFTCSECGERTEKLINRLAYERGTVFVQCAGCLQHHKLVDNLGLVVEYDLREDVSVDSNTDPA